MYKNGKITQMDRAFLHLFFLFINNKVALTVFIFGVKLSFLFQTFA